MAEKKRKKIVYVCFYAEMETEGKIVSFPSAWSKIDYVASVIKDVGYPVDILSVARSAKGKFKGFTKTVDNNERHIYFSSIAWKNILLNKLGIAMNWLKILFYLLIHVRSCDIVIVYHSLYHIKWLTLYRKVFRRPFCLEIEDVYSALGEKTRNYKATEWELFQQAASCLCVNDLIAEKLSSVKTKIISYGSYLLPEYLRTRNDTQIRLVYAGTIERDRRAAFLAVDTVRYLPSRYFLSILGFGNSEDIAALQKQIDEVNANAGSCRIEFCGRMSGEKYYRFLQNCDIGLSTHMYDETNMSSADNTFPSKVLVYMANGLRVVAQRIACLEKSKLSDYLTYYDTPNGENVAKAVMEIDMTSPYDGKKLIADLNECFKQQMKRLLQG